MSECLGEHKKNLMCIHVCERTSAKNQWEFICVVLHTFKSVSCVNVCLYFYDHMQNKRTTEKFQTLIEMYEMNAINEHKTKFIRAHTNAQPHGKMQDRREANTNTHTYTSTHARKHPRIRSSVWETVFEQ